MRRLWLLWLLSISTWAVGRAQQDSASSAAGRKAPPNVTCSDLRTPKACDSFKQLIDAHDSGVLAYFASPITYVCFRPNEDSFVMFQAVTTLGTWEPTDEKGQRRISIARLIEYRDGVQYGFERAAAGYWHRFVGSDAEPTFAADPSEKRDPEQSQDPLRLRSLSTRTKSRSTGLSSQCKWSTRRRRSGGTIIPSGSAGPPAASSRATP